MVDRLVASTVSAHLKSARRRKMMEAPHTGTLETAPVPSGRAARWISEFVADGEDRCLQQPTCSRMINYPACYKPPETPAPRTVAPQSSKFPLTNHDPWRSSTRFELLSNPQLITDVILMVPFDRLFDRYPSEPSSNR
jgi:hypothetical protein